MWTYFIVEIYMEIVKYCSRFVAALCVFFIYVLQDFHFNDYTNVLFVFEYDL